MQKKHFFGRLMSFEYLVNRTKTTFTDFITRVKVICGSLDLLQSKGASLQV